MGERIKTRRKELGMTAEELGDAIGRSRATIYKYEKGDIENLSHTLLIPLAEALHTTPEYLRACAEQIGRRRSQCSGFSVLNLGRPNGLLFFLGCIFVT